MFHCLPWTIICTPCYALSNTSKFSSAWGMSDEDGGVWSLQCWCSIQSSGTSSVQSVYPVKGGCQSRVQGVPTLGPSVKQWDSSSSQYQCSRLYFYQQFLSFTFPALPLRAPPSFPHLLVYTELVVVAAAELRVGSEVQTLLPQRWLLVFWMSISW